MKGLIIREPWIGEILSGRKTWELRSRPFHYRGEIALIRQGSGLVVGMARLVDCRAALDERGVRDTVHLHRVPQGEIGDILEKGWTIPWVLAEVRRLKVPVPYRHKPGAVITIDLDAEVEAEVRKQLQLPSPRIAARSAERMTAYEPPKPKPLALSTMSGKERAQAMAAMPHLGGRSSRSITDANLPPRSPDVTGQVSSTANALPLWSISATGSRSSGRQRLGQLRSAVGAVAMLTMLVGLITWIGRLALFGFTDVLLTWDGLRWLVWALLGALVAGLTMSADVQSGRN